ncbi:hypothetical protein ACOSP7_029974 [Xanthoceras sorbifolium]
MDRIKILITILAFLPETESQRPRPLPIPVIPQVPSRPLCASQFSLVNYACSLLPQASPMPPSLPSPPDDDYDSSHRHGHGHGHRHHRDGRQPTPEEDNCCRWLKEVDNECVCELLVRLPVFLSKPVHEYTVAVDDSCNVSFTCGGRLRP